MGNQNGKRISTDATAKVTELLKVVVVTLLSLMACVALPGYGKTGESEAATAVGYSEESLITSGFKPLRALPSEPNHVSDRVKLLHGSSYFILSNLNNFTYKPFHGQNMWIGEFAIANHGGRLEVVFNIGNDRVIAVAGYRVITEPSQPAYPSSPEPAYAPAPQTVYVPAPQPAYVPPPQTVYIAPQPLVVYQPQPVYQQVEIRPYVEFELLNILLFPFGHHHLHGGHHWGHSYGRPHWGGHRPR